MVRYFRDLLKKQGCNPKYLDRAFLAAFAADYADAMRTGVAEYARTKATRFYNENGCAYCVFLEEWNTWKTACAVWDELTDGGRL